MIHQRSGYDVTRYRQRWSAIALLSIVCFGLVPERPSRAKPCKPDDRAKLFVRYEVEEDCDVLPNYDKPGVKGQKLGWTMERGRSVIWRYNVNEEWAVVSDSRRAAHQSFPWWGFMRRHCIGRSVEQCNYPEGVEVPSSIRRGRSRVFDAGWRPVDYDQGPEAILREDVRVKYDATLRDRANFVVGNVFAGTRVDVTGVERSGGHWVYVYSPSARKWGYIEATKLVD